MDGAGSTVTQFGVTVDRDTGAVTVANTYPEGFTLPSFTLEATVKTKPPASGTHISSIRVYPHERIDALWLTPSPLTIHHGADGLRFTLLAQFDNGIVGDVTDHPGITWTSADEGKLKIGTGSDGSGLPRGALRSQAAPAGAAPTAVDVSATLGGKTASGTVHILPSWSTSLTVAPASAETTAESITARPNVLFLPDGFTDTPEDRNAFETLVRGIVRDVHTTPSLLPYNLLSGAINYWRAFVPSRQRGTSVLYELHVAGGIGGALQGREPPTPERPSSLATTDTQRLAQLLYVVGQPLPGDTTSFALQLAKWLVLYSVPLPAFLTTFATSAVYDRWLRLRRGLANERDTAFGLAHGDRPKLDYPAVARGVTPHPLRTTDAHLDQFLAGLQAQKRDGTLEPIGNRWKTGGADRGLVCILATGARYGGTRRGPFFASSLRAAGEVNLVAATTAGMGSNALDLVDNDIPTKPPLDRVATVAHETAHAFKLLDEYGGSFARVETATVETETRESGNVQLRKDVLTGTELDGAHIKWGQWPRIVKAGVLTTAPRAEGLDYRITLKSGQAAAFTLGDVVRLRIWPLSKFATSTDPDRLSVPLTVSDRQGDDIIATPVGASIDETKYAAGSLLIAPRLDPTDPVQDLMLVAPNIAAHITACGEPLNAPKGAKKTDTPRRQCSPDSRDVQSGTNLPSGLPKGFTDRTYRIVGLYEGGHGAHCQIYHPTGRCLMRQTTMWEEVPSKPSKKAKKKLEQRINYFCHVCRYAIVDRVDPTLHGKIDDLYEEHYPYP
jgi:hypothetical protein